MREDVSSAKPMKLTHEWRQSDVLWHFHSPSEPQCRLTALIRRLLTHCEFTKSSRDSGAGNSQNLSGLEPSEHIQSYSGGKMKSVSHFALTCSVCSDVCCPAFPRMPFIDLQGEFTYESILISILSCT